VGKQKYRGYFALAGATNYAGALARSGFDTYVGGVAAYSTLGWFKDAAMNTFIFDEDPCLAELIFHELSHQKVFARGDTDFNEAFATTVGEEGARRWLRACRDPGMLAKYERALERHYEFVGLVSRTRKRLEAVYGDTRGEDGELRPTRRGVGDETELEPKKRKVFDGLMREYEALKAGWGGDPAYDNWFSRDLNNAKLNSVAAYYDLVPGFRALLDHEKGDLKAFYSAAEKLAKRPRKERRELLRSFVEPSSGKGDKPEEPQRRAASPDSQG
jgi:predicted aminopeptidase